jgi:hypothetical protein
MVSLNQIQHEAETQKNFHHLYYKYYPAKQKRDPEINPVWRPNLCPLPDFY